MYNCINNPNLYKRLSNCFSFVADKHNYPTSVSKNKALKLPLPRTEVYKNLLVILEQKYGIISLMK